MHQPSTSSASNTKAANRRGNDDRLARMLWGRMAGYKMSPRIAMLVFVVAAIFAMSFSQLGFWSIGIVDGKPVYLLLLLGPLVLGAFAFGPIIAAALGLYAGAIVYAHATMFPLDYYEVYFMTALNTFFTLVVAGVLSCLLFRLLLRNCVTKRSRLVRIALVCILTSAVTSALVMINTSITYGGAVFRDATTQSLYTTPFGVFVQAAIDAGFLIIVCLIADNVLDRVNAPERDRRLLTLFSGWMITISAIVLFVTNALIFSTVTYQAQVAAEQDMLTEVDYLQKQLAMQDGDIASVLEGYVPALDGTVIITDKRGTIIASDDEANLPQGSTIERVFVDAEQYDAETLVDEYFEWVLESGTDQIAAIQTRGEGGVATLDISFLAVGRFADGYVAIVWPPEKIYENRIYVMGASTTVAFALIIAIAMVATVLLRRVVITRIDETNESLDKITQGNLNERVHVRDSREFASLSAGINATVSALRDSIAEAEQRNAKELATAKAIQESAIPRDFPPFPDIDRFDVYASMKMAKEVGGDFYDFFLIGDDKLGVVIADVSGKGIPAALFMMTAKTQIKTYMESELPIGEAIAAANHQLCVGNDAGMFVTVFACVLNYKTGELTYVNAGHNPPLLHHDGTWEWMRERSGLMMGLYDGRPYKQFSRQLECEDVLYAYTDGVTEAMNASEELFGEERLANTLVEYEAMNPRSIGVGVRRAITDFTLDAEQSDDITMVTLKYGTAPEKKAVMILRAEVDQLVHVHNFIHEELRRRNAPKSVQNPLDIAAEELFVNVCNYAYPNATPDNPGEVRISFVYDPNPPSLTVSISDDGIPYNPLEKPDAVTPSDIADVPIGGLGILMTKRSVDDMWYAYEDGSNIVTFRKSW